MPDALTARIQAALAAEAAARAPATAPAPEPVPAMSGAAVKGDGEADGGSPSSNGHRAADAAGRRAGWRGHGRSWLTLRVAAVTAAVAVIAGGGYGVAQLLSGSPVMHGAAGSGAAAGPNIKIRGPIPGRSVIGGISEPGYSSGGGGGGGGQSTTLAPLVIHSGTNYQPETLGLQAEAVLNRVSHSGSQPAPVASAPIQASLFPQLRSCLIHISNGQRPLLVDLAKYKGHPALIVVLPSRNGGRPRVLVVAPGCTGTLAPIVTTTPLPTSG
jgi:hypothetical protein